MAMQRKKIVYLFSVAVALSVLFFGNMQAASREEIAAINIKTASDFRYWNADSPTLKTITQFVVESTTPGHRHFIPTSDRIAVFDLDGTLYCETAPLYFQEMMFLHRALKDKTFTPDKKMAAFAKNIQPKILNKMELTPEESYRLSDYLTKAYEGMTPEEYHSFALKFMQTHVIGLTNLRRGEAFYLPMVEIISYLANNGFAVYINSASGFPTVRALIEGAIPIPADRIIASDFVYTTTGMGKDTPNQHFYDRTNEKVVISGKPAVSNGHTRKIFSLLNQIGKKPVLSFGNSMGDSSMFEYTLQNNPYNSFAFCVLCDDTERELGDPAKADYMKQAASKRGWNTISMRNEFKSIYGENVKRIKTETSNSKQVATKNKNGFAGKEENPPVRTLIKIMLILLALLLLFRIYGKCKK